MNVYKENKISTSFSNYEAGEMLHVLKRSLKRCTVDESAIIRKFHIVLTEALHTKTAKFYMTLRYSDSEFNKENNPEDYSEK